MHKTCFTISFISCLYVFRAHVLETFRDMKQNLLWNKFCASSWLNSEINVLRCTVSKTSKNTTTCFGPDDGLHTGPKHVVVYYILLLTVILLCSWLYVYIDIYTHYSFVSLSTEFAGKFHAISTMQRRTTCAIPMLYSPTNVEIPFSNGRFYSVAVKTRIM